MNLGNLILRITEIEIIIVGVLLLMNALKISPIKFPSLETIPSLMIGAPLLTTGIFLAALTRTKGNSM